MFHVIVEETFNALHQLRLPSGVMEPLHGHDWRVRVRCVRNELDAHGMVIDFEDVRRRVRSAIEPLHHSHLNLHPAMRGAQPTAEAVAQWIFDTLAAGGLEGLAGVEVAEAPGCWAGYAL